MHETVHKADLVRTAQLLGCRRCGSHDIRLHNVAFGIDERFWFQYLCNNCQCPTDCIALAPRTWENGYYSS